MHKLLLIVSALAALTLTAAAEAVPPIHDTISFHDQFVDTAMCGFPIVGDLVFTNDITEFRDAAGTNTTLQLHQSTVGTFTANGVTLRMNSRETIMVDFVDGVPVTAKHVGQLDHISGPNGRSSTGRARTSSKLSSTRRPASTSMVRESRGTDCGTTSISPSSAARSPSNEGESREFRPTNHRPNRGGGRACEYI